VNTASRQAIGVEAGKARKTFMLLSVVIKCNYQ
jgi:hypothetical protein